MITVFADKLNRVDKPLIAVIFVLLFVGILTCFSASAPSAKNLMGDSYEFLKKQLLYGTAGIVLMFWVGSLDYHIFKKYSKAVYIVTLVLMVMTLFMRGYNGAKRWISFPGFSFQPSELAKISIIISMAEILEKKDWKKKILPHEKMSKLKRFGINYLDFLKYFLLFVPIAGILALQPHFSCFLIIAAVVVIMIFASGADIKYFVVSAFAAVPLVIFMAFKENYRVDRITSFLDPFKDPLGTGYQTVQSLYAIGSGGLFGLGMGQSRQKYLYLPEPQNDFVFSVLCEETGFIGALVVIILFMFFVVRGFKISMTAQDKYGSLLCLGMTALIAVEAFGNIAVVTASIPPTGIPLPFFSAGGSSLMVMLAGLGVILSVSKYCNTK